MGGSMIYINVPTTEGDRREKVYTIADFPYEKFAYVKTSCRIYCSRRFIMGRNYYMIVEVHDPAPYVTKPHRLSSRAAAA